MFGITNHFNFSKNITGNLKFPFLIWSESPAKIKFNAIGAYILISLTFVVATVIQMSVLLVLKQKAEEKVISMEMAKENTKSYNIKSQRLIKKIDNM